MERIVVITTVIDNQHVFCLVREEVAQATKRLIVMTEKVCIEQGLDVPSKEAVKATWIDKSFKIVNSGRELVAECAWEKYSIAENILM